MINERDSDGQPYNVHFNAASRTERDLSELLGVAKGMLSDGVVNEMEANYLRAWGQNHPDALNKWPLNLIFSRLHQYFADERIDDVERAELQDLLGSLVGGQTSLLLGYEAPTTLPLDDPPPLICWQEEVYVFTGRFAYGPRRELEREVTGRGGRCDDNVTKQTTFLVLGSFGSRDWKHSSYGTKIRRAVELKQTGCPVRIVGEDHWASAITPF